MSYKIDYVIKELELSIPLKDFPLNFDVIVGRNTPKIILEEDEGSEQIIEPTAINDNVRWNLKDVYTACYGGRDIDLMDELKEVCKKYKGTLIVEATGEDADDIQHIRIRDGLEKKVKIVEES